VLPKVEKVSKVFTLICRTFFFLSSSRCWRNSLLLVLDSSSRASITVSFEHVMSLDLESKKRRWNIARFSSNNDSLRRMSTGDDVDGTYSEESESYFVFTLPFLATGSSASFVLLDSDHFDNEYGRVETQCETLSWLACCECRAVSKEI